MPNLLASFASPCLNYTWSTDILTTKSRQCLRLQTLVGDMRELVR